jgi:hypothetical protein
VPSHQPTSNGKKNTGPAKPDNLFLNRLGSFNDIFLDTNNGVPICFLTFYIDIVNSISSLKWKFFLTVLLSVTTTVGVANGPAVVIDQPANSLTANEIDPNINCFCPSDESRLYILSIMNLN